MPYLAPYILIKDSIMFVKYFLEIIDFLITSNWLNIKLMATDAEGDLNTEKYAWNQ